MMKITIDRKIPIPPLRSLQSQYPFGQMGVGDSFFARALPLKIVSVQTMIKRGSKAKYLSGREFITRRVDGGVRCWRVK